MKSLRLLPGLLSSTLLIVCPSPASCQEPPLRAIVERIDSLLRPLVARGDFAGTVLVARNDSILYERSFGLASVELGVANTNTTRYRLHSITKQFTAMGILLLSQRGQIDLDASVRHYLPELPEAWQDATIRELLTHTSGIPMREGEWFGSYRSNEVHNELDNLTFVASSFAKDALVSKPGTRYAYNNFGYDLLGCVIERVSATDLATFIGRSIFLPARMPDAGFDRRAEAGSGSYVASAIVPRLAYGYNGAPGHLQSATPLMWGSAGAGGMYATARDLFNYDQALTHNALVPDSIEKSSMVDGFRINEKATYGYGWIVRHVAGSTYFVHHSGGNNGYVSDYARFPLEHGCIIILTNLGWADPDEIRASIAEALFGKAYASKP